MSWYSIFYLVSVADAVETVTQVISIISLVGLVISVIGYFISTNAVSENVNWGKEEQQSERYNEWKVWQVSWKRIFTILLIITPIFSLLWVMIPSRKDCLLIIAGGGTMQFLTTDSVAKQLPRESLNFVVQELKTMSKEAKVDLGIATQKERLLDEAKKMTTEQLLERMKVDTNFAKIITNR